LFYNWARLERAIGFRLFQQALIIHDTEVSYKLVNTAAEPVPEPITVGGTALALAGLSWLKHKKKIAV
jgi:hypothetical protein